MSHFVIFSDMIFIRFLHWFLSLASTADTTLHGLVLPTYYIHTLSEVV